mgnify:CR=1 FL=1
MGKGKGLPYQSRYYYLCSIYPHVGDLNFGPHGYTTEMADSFGAILGHWLVPIFAPIGLGFWQIAVALIAGISAKEVVVSSCAFVGFQ